MNELKIFNSPEFGQIRVMDIDGEPWFVGKDVAEALGYQKPENAVSTHVDEEDKTSTLIQGSGSNYKSKAIIINESGLYSLVLSSKLPTAKKFKRWVTSEVLPSIRKHGAYMTPQTLEQALASPDFLIQLATKLKEEQEARKAAEAKIEADKQKVLFANMVSASDSSVLVRELAKLLRQNGVPMGEHRLYAWMRDGGYIIKGSTLPTQKAMEMGLFEMVERTILRGEGLPRVMITTRVTGKGQIYFMNKLLNKQEELDVRKEE
ncbi:MAG: BRO family protein [Lachnospiraceae bacterium]